MRSPFQAVPYLASTLEGVNIWMSTFMLLTTCAHTHTHTLDLCKNVKWCQCLQRTGVHVCMCRARPHKSRSWKIHFACIKNPDRTTIWKEFISLPKSKPVSFSICVSGVLCRTQFTIYNGSFFLHNPSCLQLLPSGMYILSLCAPQMHRLFPNRS